MHDIGHRALARAAEFSRIAAAQWSRHFRSRRQELRESHLALIGCAADLQKLAWIDAEHELPPQRKLVLIHCPVADDPVWLGSYSRGHWRTPDGETIDNVFVDHWMRLPEPPDPDLVILSRARR